MGFRKQFLFVSSLFSLLLIGFAFQTEKSSAETNSIPLAWRWTVRLFQKQDETNPPPKHAILFLGSSSFRKWTGLAAYFPDKQVINRGFGGSKIADSTALLDWIVFPYEPRMIVFYAGDNDLAEGLSPEKVAANFKEFFDKVHARLPQTRIAFLSIKPSPLRWRLDDKIKAANELIKNMKNDNLTFIDIYPLMLGPDGLPRRDLYLLDGLHPSLKCYEMWAKAIRPYLE